MKSASELQREIDEAIAAGGAPAKRKRKAKVSARPTETDRLREAYENKQTHVRASRRHASPDLSEQIGELAGARRALGRALALDLGHSPATQGIAFECSQCDASGSFDVEPIGTIFTRECTSPKAAAQIAYRKS